MSEFSSGSARETPETVDHKPPEWPVFCLWVAWKSEPCGLDFHPQTGGQTSGKILR